MATHSEPNNFPDDHNEKDENSSSRADARDVPTPKDGIERSDAAEICQLPPKKPSSKRVEANRRNAALSTGPKTLQGKRNASKNATRHGLLSQDVVVAIGHHRESQEDFDALLDDMRDCFKPRSLIEDFLVRELTITYWRSARALRCERGALTQVSHERQSSPLSELERLFLDTQSDEEARHTLQNTLGGVNYMIHELEKIRAEASSTGTISVKSQSWFARFCGNGEKTYSKQDLVAAVEKSAAEWSERRILLEEERLQTKNAEIDAVAIPAKDALDRILRYDAKYFRHRLAILGMLERFRGSNASREDCDDTGLQKNG